MAKRTQDPWEARPHQFGGCWWVETPDGRIQVSMETSNTDESYARFIAAAPDMETALEMCLGVIRMLASDAEMEAYRVGKAALAKATGDNL